jgi:hypothetical protein
MAYGIERLQQFGYKVETTEGTPVALVAADYDSATYSAEITNDRQVIERLPIRSTFSPLQGVGGSLMGAVKATLEPRGAGVDGTAPDWMQLLRAAGGTLTGDVVTFGEPVLAAQEIGTTVTCATRDGIFERILAGVRGSAKIYAEAPGQPIRLDFEGMGAYTQAAQTALIAAVAPVSGQPPVLLSSALSIGGSAVQYKSCEIAIENEVKGIPDGSSASGYGRFLIVNQRIKFRAAVWQTNTSLDWFARTANGASDSLAVSWAFGSGVGLVQTITGNVYLDSPHNKAYDESMAVVNVSGEFFTTGAAASLTITQS